MKSKQEVIQHHYIDLLNADKFSKLMPHIDENGWCITLDQMGERVSPPLKELGFTREQMDDLTDHCHIHGNLVWRPKTLQGIESNNGWTRIESVDDIPKEITECYIFDDDGDISYFTFGFDSQKDYDEVVNGVITHYQPIIKPEAPIY